MYSNDLDIDPDGDPNWIGKHEFFQGKHEVPEHHMSAEEHYLRSCGLEPTPDAIAQLRDAFLPCLRIMCERGYDPNGSTWGAHGWRGNLFYVKAKIERAWQKSWVRGHPDTDSITDAINFAGFYLRGLNDPPWGEWGPPGDE